MYSEPRTPHEEALAAIWSALLRVPQIGRNQSFLALGGDSILAVQVSSQARAIGIDVTPKQVLEHPTLARLAASAGMVPRHTTDAGLVTGEVELTPIQRWFFERDFADAAHWNMAVMFEVREAIDPAVLERALAQVVLHHDALRLRFSRENGEWRQRHAEIDECDAVLSRVDLSDAPEADLASRVAEVVDGAHRMFDLSRAPLLRAVLIEQGTGRSARLLFVAHHLVVDGISWRILLEDVELALKSARLGQFPTLPPKTTSFRSWSARLRELAQSNAARDEVAYWVGLTKVPIAPLPRDSQWSVGTVADERTVVRVLTDGETRALLREATAAYHARIHEMLLAPLVATLAECGDRGDILIEVEGHGREEIDASIGTERTVGWFTTLFPVLFTLGDAREAHDVLKVVKEAIRSVPRGGIGYGVLRYLSDDEVLRARLAALPRPEVCFEYLGQFDQALASESVFALAPESVGSVRSPHAARPHILNVGAIVLGGRLSTTWAYDRRTYRASTIEKWADHYVAHLRRLIEGHRGGARAYTPSDFPKANIDAETLARALSRASKRHARKG